MICIGQFSGNSWGYFEKMEDVSKKNSLFDALISNSSKNIQSDYEDGSSAKRKKTVGQGQFW